MAPERHISEYVLDWVDQERRFRAALEQLPVGDKLTAHLRISLEDEKRQFLQELHDRWLRIHRLTEMALAAIKQVPQSGEHL